jgi:ATP-binding cassette, subfamily A (ABC1), member 3
LNVFESLQLYAILRGIHCDVKSHVNDVITVFKLTEYRYALVQNLSGGNKRKVSSAIAFLGKPSVIILDEPSTGE